MDFIKAFYKFDINKDVIELIKQLSSCSLHSVPLKFHNHILTNHDDSGYISYFNESCVDSIDTHPKRPEEGLKGCRR